MSEYKKNRLTKHVVSLLSLYRRNFFLVIEFSEFALDGEALLAFLDVAHNLSIDVERFRNLDDLLGNLRTNVDFHAVSHVEYLVHFLPVGTRALVDGTEEWGYGEHVVLDDAAVVADKVQHLGLSATCAMYHTVNLWAQLVKQFLDDGRLGAGGRKNQLTSVDR